MVSKGPNRAFGPFALARGPGPFDYFLAFKFHNVMGIVRCHIEVL